MRENPENNIENPEKMNKKTKDTLASFQRKFIRKKIQENWVNFLENFSENEILDDFKIFLNLDEKWQEILNKYNFNSSDFRTNTLNSLKAEILKQTFWPRKTIESIKQSYQKEYNLDNSQENILNNNLEKLNIEELKALSFSQNKREDFLLKNKIFESKEQARQNMKLNTEEEKTEKILKDINVDISSLNDNEKELLFNIVEIWLWNFWKVNSEQLSQLFLKLDKKSAINLIKLFIKNLSYKELIDLWILNEQRIKEEVKKDIIKFYEEKFNENDLENNEEKLKLLQEKINVDDIVVNIEKLGDDIIYNNFINQWDVVYSDWNIYKKWTLKKEIAKKIEEELNSYVASAKEEIYSDPEHLFAKMNIKNCNWWKCSLTEKPENFHKSFVDFIKSPDSWIDLNLRNKIEKLQKWNFLILKDKNTGEKTYYNISDIDFWDSLENKKIILKDITWVNWIYDPNWNSWDYLRYEYNDFYNTLKSLSDPNSSFELDILNTQELENSWIEKVEEEDKITSSKSLIKKVSQELLKKSNTQAENFSNNLKNLVIVEKWWDWKWWDMSYEIIDFNDNTQTLKVKWWNKTSTIKYNDLYKLIAKRPWNWDIFEKINNWNEFLNEISKQNSKFENLKIWKNLLVDKTNDSHKYNVLRNEKSWIWIEIKKLKDNQVEYVIWKFNSKWELKDIKYKTDSFSKLFLDIKKYDLNPLVEISEIIKKQNEELENEWEDPKAKKSFLTWVLWRMSILEIWMAFKKIPEVLKQRLEKWNQLSSALLATKLWKFLWDWVYYDLKSQFASEENKIIEELADSRKRMWTKEMLDLIEKRVIKTSNAPRYEVEAAMAVLLWKYWSLYPKRFHKYRGTFLWYKRFWWKKWDKMYIKIQKKCLDATTSSWKEEPIPFTEEVLLEEHLKQLDKDFPFRVRPRADKHFWKEKKSWIADSIETWEKKAWDMPTLAERLNYTLSLFPWEEAEWIGWIKKIIEKNGSNPSDLHMVPFILTASWIAKDFDPVLIKELKSLAYKTSYPELAFNSTETNIKKYQKYVIEATRLKLWDEKAEELEKIININDKEKRIKKLRAFWDEYWTTLIDTISWNDGLVLQKAEKHNEENISKKEKDQSLYLKNYIDTFTQIVNDWNYNIASDDELINDFFGVNWLYNYSAALSWKMNWDIESDTKSRLLFDWYIDYFKSLRNLKDKNGNLVPEYIRRNLFKKSYKVFEEKIKQQIKGKIVLQATRWKMVWEEVEQTLRQIPVTWKILANWLDVFRGDEIERSDEQKYNSFLDNLWDNFLNFNSWEEEDILEKPSLEKVTEDAQKRVDETVNNPDYNK